MTMIKTVSVRAGGGKMGPRTTTLRFSPGIRMNPIGRICVPVHHLKDGMGERVTVLKTSFVRKVIICTSI